MGTDVAAAPSVTEIPVVDFAGFSDDDPARRAATAAAIRAALETYGFLYLRNHGVPAPVVEAVFAQSQVFFHLPQEQKEAVRSKEAGNPLGYGGVGGQALAEDRPGDLKELFQMKRERPGAPPNLWPAELPAFREALVAFQAAAVTVCDRLMQAVAISLGLPQAYFEPYYDHSRATVNLLHYPQLEHTPAPGQLRAGAHTDFGGISLLFPGEGGLEIQMPDGTWIPAPAVPGAAIVNSGDLIERWSNSQFRSSPHRVVNPVGEATTRDRYSVVLFHGPNEDALITCLEPCQSADRPAKYPPITAGEHIRGRALSSRGQSFVG
jgi:isopenicillin N synthase-like dioxygenase